MARRMKKVARTENIGLAGSLVTFTDIITLLLTFFVLLLSMTSMEKPLLTRISATTGDTAAIDHAARGRVPDTIQLILDILNDPENIDATRDRLKDLLFPNEILPKEISPGKLEENLRVLAHPEGVVLVLTEALLFPPGTHELTPAGQHLLSALTPVLHYSNADMNIAAHTDSSENAVAMEAYELSGRRAMSVLEYFLQQKLRSPRFSISGYGPDKPIEPNTSVNGRAQNRRVELLLKTTPWLGGYL